MDHWSSLVLLGFFLGLFCAWADDKIAKGKDQNRKSKNG